MIDELKKPVIKFGYLIKRIGEFIQPDYWICTHCGLIKWREQEVLCWKCGAKGEMIYKGDLC